MKTILALLLALLTLTIGFYLLTISVEVFNNSSQTYLGQTTNEVYTFKLPLLIATFLLVVFSIILFTTTSTFISIFYNNIQNNLKRKRDNDIKKQLLDKKYDKLYDDLNNTNIYEEKERIVRQFYEDTHIKGIKSLLNSILKDKERENANKYSKEPIFADDIIGKKESIVKERDTYAG